MVNLGEGDDFQVEEFAWDIKPKINVGTIEDFQEQPKWQQNICLLWERSV